MTLSAPPACRHRGPAVGAAFRCHSPKLVGLKLVTAQTCEGCFCRDHAGGSATAPPPRLLPCLYLGGTIRPGVHACGHPGHGSTTPAGCRSCPDYLYPLLTPQTPVEAVRRMIGLPSRPQPAGCWSWPNVRQAQREEVAALLDRPPPEFAGRERRGVVIAGGGRYFASAYVTVRVLRHVGCRLPVELWHLAGEVTAAMAELLRPYGVECVDADRVALERPFRFIEGHWWKGWQLKPYAVAHSRFREALFLDADCYPVRDPSFLFDWPAYRRRGAAFWPDLLGSEGLLPPGLDEVFGAEPRLPPLESGQFLVDKARCRRELGLALWYNAQADFVYRYVWGDKDTFNLAWARLGRAYAMPRRRSSFDMHTILQNGPDGEVLFQHRCRDKFRLGSEVYDGTPQFHAANRFNPRLAHEALCFAFLDELAQAGV